jgi:hypothetical protein
MSLWCDQRYVNFLSEVRAERLGYCASVREWRLSFKSGITLGEQDGNAIGDGVAALASGAEDGIGFEGEWLMAGGAG